MTGKFVAPEFGGLEQWSWKERKRLAEPYGELKCITRKCNDDAQVEVQPYIGA